MGKNRLSKQEKRDSKNKIIGFRLGSILWIFIFLIIILSPTEEIKKDCNLINCKIIDTTEVYGGVDCSSNYTDILGNDVCDNIEYYYPTIYEEEICGWEESYYWFKNIKDNFRGDKNKLFLECE